MTRNLRLLALSLMLAVIGAACGDAGPAPTATQAAAPPLIDVAVVTASPGRIESSLRVSGTLAPRARVGLKPKLPGALERILVDIGDAVTVGQTIATIDRREIDAQADAAVAAVAVAHAQAETSEAVLANATLELDRSRDLFEQGALPRQRLDAAQTAHRTAVAQRDLANAMTAQADAALRRVREIQSDATLTSPVTGVVVARNYDAGAMPGSEPVVVVADTRQLKLEAGVSELEAGRLRIGLPATLAVQAKPGKSYSGELAAISPEVSERNRHFRIEIRVNNADGALLSGMHATADLVLETAEATVLVPREAVTTLDGVRVALRVAGDTATAVPVTEGLSDEGHVQIVDGLAAGDQVVADARRQIPAGARVKAIVVN